MGGDFGDIHLIYADLDLQAAAQGRDNGLGIGEAGSRTLNDLVRLFVLFQHDARCGGVDMGVSQVDLQLLNITGDLRDRRPGLSDVRELYGILTCVDLCRLELDTGRCHLCFRVIDILYAWPHDCQCQGLLCRRQAALRRIHGDLSGIEIRLGDKAFGEERSPPLLGPLGIVRRDQRPRHRLPALRQLLRACPSLHDGQMRERLVQCCPSLRDRQDTLLNL